MLIYRKNTITIKIVYRIRGIFTLDLRALALFRIGLALLIIFDLTLGALDLRAFFTDQGVLPTDLLLNNYTYENIRAFHSISGTYARQVTLLIINYLIAFCLLVGRQSKLMHILVWAFFSSLSARNPIINSGADSVMRVLLFWSIFLPTNIRRSIDRKNKEKPVDPTFFSRATVGLVFQVASIYLRNYILKTDLQRKGAYTATYTTMSIDMLRARGGNLLYQFPQVMRFITWFWITLQGRGMLLFLIPWKQRRRRTLCCFLFMGIHIGMLLTLKLGYFPRVCIAAWVVLLPTQFRSLFLPVQQSKIPYLKTKRSYWLSAFLIGCILYITARNLRTTNFDKRAEYFPVSINKYGFLLRIEQYRSMFAPYPIVDDGRFVISGKSQQGKSVNLLVPGTPVTYEKPTDFDTLYPTEKRRKLFLNYANKAYAAYRKPYLQRQCTHRNKNNPTQRITSASMERLPELTLDNYQVQSGEVVLLATEPCK